ncbi:ATP-binding cassette domain-containing protein [Paenibacillus radicis (ex Xue et al. 2023)]|uniref:ATP-binding cassette domain-containing protein n=1 Tax=Paenibacillus radicis (ex Xue et al. 2023) TaxID=2972489 RepID=A0ABT1YPX1_9BACL|nr:ATP-binding cassette domain-containing protein [Paenibacillus radicis (ex Xue et al. 2023)]MCR8635067.1 ATP-binding cassette domain-containing protein [Paenibacillus radicis (ex Xue et al. 2023)]
MINVEQLTVGKPNSSNKNNRSEPGPILTNINCRLQKGTVTLIAGQTGSGKSTFLNAIAGLIPLQAGTISYDGKSLWNGQRMNNAIKFKMSVLFQYPERQLFAESIRKEFLYSLRPLRLSKQETAARINEAMNRMKLPEELLTESFFTLSDGQKRKVAIATSLATKPEWLLLDEPTAGIDPLSIPHLLEAIDIHKRVDKGGIILVSHDLDTFLPVADRVLVMHKGTLVADLTPKELCDNPGILVKAQIGLPTSVEIANIMLELGIPLSGTSITPDETADAIIRQIRQRSTACESLEHSSTTSLPSADPAYMVSRESSITDPTADTISTPAANVSLNPESTAPSAKSISFTSILSTAVQQLHPITKWLFYLLLSSGILIQDQWYGIGAAAIITCICMYLSGAPIGALLKPVKPFLFFILISALISGLTLTFYPDSIKLAAVDFSIISAAQTTKQLSIFLLIMVLGILFALTTTGSKMQRGLEQAFSFLEYFRIPVAAFTFSASLLLRFVPILFAEIERISLITRARGKANVKQGSIRVRDAHVFMIPLILSMMKHAEDLAFALEARGYRVKRVSRLSYNKIPFHLRDLYTLTAGFLLLAVLIFCDW